jgi:hypothetical protein
LLTASEHESPPVLATGQNGSGITVPNGGTMVSDVLAAHENADKDNF